MTEQELIDYTLSLIPKEEKDRVFRQECCGIDNSFIGFLEPYYHLSKIISKDYTIFDFGAAYNPQCYFFTEHKKYIAISPIEIDGKEMFKASNCDIYRCTTGYFLNHYYKKEGKQFAIVNNVPNWYKEDSMNLAKTFFRNCYTFYTE